MRRKGGGKKVKKRINEFRCLASCYMYVSLPAVFAVNTNKGVGPTVPHSCNNTLVYFMTVNELFQNLWYMAASKYVNTLLQYSPASVGLAQACPNNVQLVNQSVVPDNLVQEACQHPHY